MSHTDQRIGVNAFYAWRREFRANHFRTLSGVPELKAKLENCGVDDEFMWHRRGLLARHRGAGNCAEITVAQPSHAC